MILYVPPCPQVNIRADKTEICTGETVTLYAATYNTNYVYYQWYLNNVAVPGEIYPTYKSNSFNNKDEIYCMITGSTCGPKMSNIITIIVNQKGVPTININYTNLTVPTTETRLICEGDLLLFQSTITSGGTAPIYQWFSKKDGDWAIIPGEIYSFMKYNPEYYAGFKEKIACYLGSNAWCVDPSGVTSNVIELDVTQKVPVSVSISVEPEGVICSGTEVTFTANGVNKGSAPSYQWYVNYTIVGETRSAYTYTPVNGDIVGIIMENTTDRCVKSNPAYSLIGVNIIDNETPNIDIESYPKSSSNTCYVNNGVNILFTVTNVEGVCGNETYRWLLTSGSSTWTVQWTTSKFYTLLSTNQDRSRVECWVYSDCSCLNSNPGKSNTIDIVITGSTLKSISIVSDKNEICSGSTVCFTGATIGFTGAATYQWKDGGSTIAGATDFPYWCTSALTTGIHYITCEATEGVTKTSNTIIITVNPLKVPYVEIEQTPGETVICTGTTIYFNISDAVYLGTNPSYQWKFRESSEVSWTNISPGGNYIYYYTNSINNGNQIQLFVSNINTPCAVEGLNCRRYRLSALGSDSTDFCYSDCSNVDHTITVEPGDSEVVCALKDTAISCGGDDYYTIEEIGFCTTTTTSVTSNTITVTGITSKVRPSVTITGSTDCVTLNQSITFTATTYNVGGSPTFKWYVLPDTTTPVQSGPSNIFSYTFTNPNILYGNILCYVIPSLTCVDPTIAYDTISLPLCPTQTWIGVDELYIEIYEEATQPVGHVDELCCITPIIDGSHITISSSNPGSLTTSPYIEQTSNSLGAAKKINIKQLKIDNEFLGSYTSYLFYMTGEGNIFSLHGAAKIRIIHNGNTIASFSTLGTTGQGPYMNWYEAIYIDVFNNGNWYASPVSTLYPSGRPQYQAPVWPRATKQHNNSIAVGEWIYLFDTSVGAHTGHHWEFVQKAYVEGEGEMWFTNIQNPKIKYLSSGDKTIHFWVNGLKTIIFITVT